VLATWEQWALVRLLLIVGGVAVWRAMQLETGPGDARVLAAFVVLVFALSLLAWRRLILITSLASVALRLASIMRMVTRQESRSDPWRMTMSARNRRVS